MARDWLRGFNLDRKEQRWSIKGLRDTHKWAKATRANEKEENSAVSSLKSTTDKICSRDAALKVLPNVEGAMWQQPIPSKLNIDDIQCLPHISSSLSFHVYCRVCISLGTSQSSAPAWESPPDPMHPSRHSSLLLPAHLQRKSRPTCLLPPTHQLATVSQQKRCAML